jgi:hypothetical protein
MKIKSKLVFAEVEVSFSSRAQSFLTQAKAIQRYYLSSLQTELASLKNSGA